jgi:hypothetical protein
MRKFVYLSIGANPLVNEVVAEIRQTYKVTKTNGRI